MELPNLPTSFFSEDFGNGEEAFSYRGSQLPGLTRNQSWSHMETLIVLLALMDEGCWWFPERGENVQAGMLDNL